MKKFIILLTLPFVFGCQKYEQITIPKLTGGKWIFYDYDIVVTSSISSVSVIKNDTICINSFNNQSFVSGDVIMKQNYQQTAIDRRFIIGKTLWEFDSNNKELYCEFSNQGGSLRPTHEPFWVNLYPTKNGLSVDNLINGGYTFYTYDTNELTPTKLTLLSPQIITDLYLSNGTRDKAVSIRVLLKFMR